MLLSALFSAKYRSSKAAENKKRERIRAARLKVSNNTATPEDVRVSRGIVIPVSGFWYLLKSLFGFIESIPVTLIAVKVIVIILIISFIVSLIYWIMSAIAASTINMAIDAATTAMNFRNPYMNGLMIDSEMDSDGAFRTVLRSATGQQTPEDPSGGTKIPTDEDIIVPMYTEITDVNFWCNLSDTQIQEILNAWCENGELVIAGHKVVPNDHNYVYMANMFRLIRMAYRVCYVEDDSGSRIFKNIEPATLIGVLFQEKGYGWLDPTYFTCYTKGACYNRTGAGCKLGSNLSATYDIYWQHPNYTLDKDFSNWSIDSWGFGFFSPYYHHYNSSGADIADYYSDGPYSLTAARNVAGDKNNNANFIKLFNGWFTGDGPYVQAYKKLLDYSTYAPLKHFYNTDTGTWSHEDIYGSGNTRYYYMFSFLLPSMIWTAANYSTSFYTSGINEYYTAIDFDKWFNEDGTGKTVSEIGERGLKSAKEISDKGVSFGYCDRYFRCSTDFFWDTYVASTGKTVEGCNKSNGLALEWCVGSYYGYTKLEDIPAGLVALVAKQAASALYHQIHHLPGMPCGTWTWNSKYAGVSTKDLMACLGVVTAQSVLMAGLNLNNYDCVKTTSVIKGTINSMDGSDVQPSEQSDASWNFIYVANGYDYVVGVSGDRCYNNDVTRDAGITACVRDLQKMSSGSNPTVAPFVNNATGEAITASTSGEGTSLFYKIYEKNGSSIGDILFTPLAFANRAQFEENYAVNRYLDEGMVDALCGGDIIDVFMKAAMIKTPDLIGKTEIITTTSGALYDVNNKYIKAAMANTTLVPLGGFSKVLNSSGTGFSQKAYRRNVFPLVDTDGNLANGITSPVGEIVMNNGAGEYQGGGFHAGTDWCTGTSALGIDVSTNTYAANWDGLTISDPWAVWDYIQDFWKDNPEFFNYNPIVAPCDCKITKIAVGVADATGKDYGNFIVLEYEAQRGYYTGEEGELQEVNAGLSETFYIHFAHMSPEFPWVLASSLRAQGNDDGADAILETLEGVTYSAASGTVGSYKFPSSDIYMKQGTLIGFAASTGWSTGNHLHLGFYDSTGVSPQQDAYTIAMNLCYLTFGAPCFALSLYDEPQISDNLSYLNGSGKYYLPYMSNWLYPQISGSIAPVWSGHGATYPGKVPRYSTAVYSTATNNGIGYAQMNAMMQLAPVIFPTVNLN